MTEDEQLESAARLTSAIDSFGRTAMEIRAQRDELLAALKALLDISPFADNPMTKHIHDAAEIAVARAEGADHA